MEAPNNSSAAAVLLDTLRRSSRRLARREALADVLKALPIALLLPLVVTVWRLVAPVPPALVLGSLAAGMVGYAVYCAWRLSRTESLARGAAELDREASLNDALKTAEWFVREPPDSPWVARQVERAAEQAASLEVDRLIPVAAPRTLWTRAALVALVLGALNIAPPLALRAMLPTSSVEHPTLTAEELETIQEIRELLEKADLAPATRRRLTELLDMLEANELRAEDTLAALEEAQDLLSNPEGTPEDADNAQGKPEDAANKPPGANKANGDQAKGDPSEGQPESDQEKESEEARNGSDQAREQASNELRKLQNNVEARQKNQEQRAGNDQNEEAQNEDAQNADNSSQGGEKESQAKGDQEAKKSASNANDPSASDKGGQGSDPSSEGDAQGQPGDPTKLDVTLKRAALKTEVEPDILTPKELIEKDTKAGESKLQYEAVTKRTEYDQAEPIGTHEIPWMYRELVKTYFEAVAPRGTHDHD